MFKNIQILEVDNFCFFQMFFFFTKCAPFLLKIKEDFKINDYKGQKDLN
jgi:hypothetical protein